jgi:hypothetical protein
MNKKGLSGIALMLIVALSAVACKKTAPSDMPEDYTPPKDTTTYISDLALIYQGGTHRLAWTKDQLKPYIFRTSTTPKVDWLFDGFLFIEFKDNLGHEYANGYGQRPAGKADWQWLLDRNFEKDKAISALDAVLDSLGKLKQLPARKRKVVLTLPEPIVGFKEWGQLHHSSLNFDLAGDRLEACKWYIETALAKWDAAKFKHVELTGFYWVAEHNTGAAAILPEIAAFIHEKHKRFYWIPYYGAEGAAQWSEMGFDIAYQQPNYFFQTSTPYSILTGALDFARRHKMALEMEFDSRVVDQPEFRTRYTDYINEFQRYGVWDNLPVAYYEGGSGWLDMFLSKDTAVRKLYDMLADIIVKRQQYTDKRLGK